MVKHITIFTTNTCAFCVMVEKYLDSKKLSYKLVNLDDHPERIDEVLQLSGSLAVPVTVVTRSDDTSTVVVGYNVSKLAAAIA